MTMRKKKQYECSVESTIIILRQLSSYISITTSELCLVTGYSHAAIEKTIRVLRLKGWVVAKRGPGGGFLLNKPLEEIKMGEFLENIPESRWAFSMSLVFLSEMTLHDFIVKSTWLTRIHF